MSTTTNIGLFKHDNPATNTDEFNVDKALNENWDKLDTAIGTDRERITTLETDNTTNKQDILELEAENTRLRQDLNGLPKGQVSGETLDLTDSAEMRCELKISGNSVQDGEPTPDTPVEVECCGDNGSINEVICNKNLLPINVTEKTMYGITITKKSDGTYSLNGTATTSFTFDLYSGDYIKLPSGTYTGQSGQMLGFYIRKDSGDFQTLSETNKKTNTFTITEDFIYNRIYMYIFSGKTYNNTILTPMLEEGSIATEFEEHKTQTYTIPTQQPMRSVGDIRDEFVKVDDKWFERHYIARKIFDGTETFTTYTDNNINIFCSSTDIIQSIDYSKVYSSHFVSSNSYASLVDSYGKVAIRSSGKRIYFTVNFTTLDDWKAWLSEQYNAGTPVYVDYILETPLDIECTEEQSTILDQIEKEAKTYKNVTHIYSTDEISPNVDITYKKDIDTMITNIEQAILSQGGNI